MKFEIISSPSNGTVKSIKALKQKKSRIQEHKFLAEGEKIVKEALLSEFQVDIIVFSNSNLDLVEKFSSLVEKRGIPSIVVDDKIFKALSDTQTPQGVLAVVNRREYELDKLLYKEKGFIVVLDGINDPGNLGTIIRTVDAAGGDGVILVNDCVEACNPKAIRATMGSVFRVPIFETGLPYLIDLLISTNWHLAVSHLEGENIFNCQNPSDKVALVVGSESHGVSESIRNNANSLIKIPMFGGAESLNATVAAGILIYEIVRKRFK